MDKVDYINIMATANQIEGISDLDTNQDTEAAQFDHILDQAKREILISSVFKWNSHFQTLIPNSNGDVRIPNRDAVVSAYVENSLADRIVERQKGEALWDREKNEKYSQSIKLLISDNVDYNKIPDLFGNWIAWRAAELMSIKINGVGSDIGYIINEKRKARLRAMNSEPGTFDGMIGFSYITSAYSRLF